VRAKRASVGDGGIRARKIGIREIDREELRKKRRADRVGMDGRRRNKRA